MLPNITEAAMFTGMEFRSRPDKAYICSLLDSLNHPCVVLTGAGYREEEAGVAVRSSGGDFEYIHAKEPGSFHGTGDMFAACFTGALMQEKSLEEAVKIAAEFVRCSIRNTLANPAHRYGVKFETALPDLIRMLGL